MLLTTGVKSLECWFGFVDFTSRYSTKSTRFSEQVVEEQNTAAIRDLCRALQQHKLLESPHLHVRSLALEVKKLGCRFGSFGFW